MSELRKYLNILENIVDAAKQKEHQRWMDEAQKYWPVSSNQLYIYMDGSHTKVDSDGDLIWTQNGKTHRDGDKPAIISADGRELIWKQNGKLHRDGDKPAWIHRNGMLEWWKNHQLHRLNGPAVINLNKSGPDQILWFWKDKNVPVHSQAEFIDYLKTQLGLQFTIYNKQIMNNIRKYIDILETAGNDELQKYHDEVKYWQNERSKYWPVSPELMAQYNDGTNTEKIDGNLRWYQTGQLHRDGDLYWRNKNGQLHRDGDKPAVIGGDGGLLWCQNGERHRDGNKPAVIQADGSLFWYQNGKQHRFGGPARIYPDGKLQWYWRGEKIPVTSQEEFIEYLKKHKGLQRFRVNKP